MKKLITLLLMLTMFAASTMQALASVAIEAADREVDDLEVIMSNEAGCSIVVGNWITTAATKTGNIHKREIRAIMPAGVRQTQVAAIYQVHDGSTNQTYYLPRRGGKRLSLDAAVEQLKAALPLSITRTGSNKDTFGFRIIGGSKNYRVTIRQLTPYGRAVAMQQISGTNGWKWLPRRQQATKAAITIKSGSRILLTQTIIF